MENRGIVNFIIAGSAYGVLAQDVYRIIDADMPIAYLPLVESYILGVISFETEIIPVVSLRKFFKNSQPDSSVSSKIIIMQKENTRLGLLIEGETGFLQGPEELADLRLIRWEDFKR